MRCNLSKWHDMSWLLIFKFNCSCDIVFQNMMEISRLLTSWYFHSFWCVVSRQYEHSGTSWVWWGKFSLSVSFFLKKKIKEQQQHDIIRFFTHFHHYSAIIQLPSCSCTLNTYSPYRKEILMHAHFSQVPLWYLLKS